MKLSKLLSEENGNGRKPMSFVYEGWANIGEFYPLFQVDDNGNVINRKDGITSILNGRNVSKYNSKIRITVEVIEESKEPFEFNKIGKEEK